MTRPDGSVDRVFARARAAQPGWAATGLRQRLAVVVRLRALIAADHAALLASLDAPHGDTAAEALTAQIVPLADACRFLTRRAPAVLAERRVGARGRPLWLFGVRSRIRREARGVVLIIAPSNYRLFLPAVQALQGLVAGNAVVVKPAPGGGAPMQRLAELLAEAGLPTGLFEVLDTDRATGEAAVAADLDHLVLTGSAATGAALRAALAPRAVSTTMELSGSDAVFVMADADIELAADGIAWGLALNGGATCIAPRRVFVAAGAAPALIAALARRLVGAAALEIDVDQQRRVAPWIAAAIAAGAQRVGGDVAGEPGAMRPQLLCHTDLDSPLMTEDFFAPVASLVTVVDMAQALAFDGRCGYALGAAVYGPAAAAEALAERIDAATVTVNDLIAPTADARLAFAARGTSGYGTTRGEAGLLDMTQPKTVIGRRGRLRPHTQAPTPHDPALFTAYLRLVHGRGLALRLRALVDLMAAGMRRQRRPEG